MAYQSTTIYGARNKVTDLEVKYKKKYVYGLTYPFTQPSNSKKSRFFSKVSGLALRKTNALQLIKTNPGERVMLPSFGAGLGRYLFEQMDEDTIDDIKEAITENIDQYMPEVDIVSIDIGPSNYFVPDSGITPHNIEYDKNTVRVSVLLRNKDLQDIFLIYTVTGGEQLAITAQDEPVGDQGSGSGGFDEGLGGGSGGSAGADQGSGGGY